MYCRTAVLLVSPSLCDCTCTTTLQNSIQSQSLISHIFEYLRVYRETKKEWESERDRVGERHQQHVHTIILIIFMAPLGLQYGEQRTIKMKKKTVSSAGVCLVFIFIYNKRLNAISIDIHLQRAQKSDEGEVLRRERIMRKCNRWTLHVYQRMNGWMNLNIFIIELLRAYIPVYCIAKRCRCDVQLGSSAHTWWPPSSDIRIVFINTKI